jgi:hypothetical protein
MKFYMLELVGDFVEGVSVPSVPWGIVPSGCMKIIDVVFLIKN